jgi:hypothetical protein
MKNSLQSHKDRNLSKSERECESFRERKSFFKVFLRKNEREGAKEGGVWLS